MPFVAGLFNEMVRRLRSPAPGSIVRKIARRKSLPHIQDRIHNSPGRVDAVVTVKERRITDGTIVEQRLVSRSSGVLAEIRIAEIQRNIGDVDVRPGALRMDVQSDAFVGLNMDHQTVRSDVALHVFTEEQKRAHDESR